MRKNAVICIMFAKDDSDDFVANGVTRYHLVMRCHTTDPKNKESVIRRKDTWEPGTSLHLQGFGEHCEWVDKWEASNIDTFREFCAKTRDKDTGASPDGRRAFRAHQFATLHFGMTDWTVVQSWTHLWLSVSERTGHFDRLDGRPGVEDKFRPRASSHRWYSVAKYSVAKCATAVERHLRVIVGSQ